MGWFFALSSRDPNLVGCVLHLLQGVRPLRPATEPRAYGMGYYQAAEPLLERQPMGGPRFDVYRLAEHLDSEVLLAQASGKGFHAKDENTEPFRFRRWLFAGAGRVEDFSRVRSEVVRALPDYWQRQTRGDTEDELVFMYLLRRIKDRGLLEEPEAPAAALGRAVREGLLDLEAVLREQGAARQSPLSCAITNGRSLAVARVGTPVSQRLIEGLLPCPHCGLDEKTPENHPSLRPHRRLRAVAFVSDPAAPGSVDLPERTVVTVSPNLELRSEPL